MPTFAPGYVPPGFYVQQEDISTPDITPGIRISAVIGQGAKTLGRQETLVKGAKNGQDGPLSNNIVINLVSVKDQNNVVYKLGRDFQLARSGDDAFVDWSPKASLTGTIDLTTLAPDPGTALNGLVFRLVVDGGTGTPADQYITFSGPMATPADVATFINTWHASLVGVASINAQNQLVLTANSVVIDEGNANGVLGFNTGASAQVLEPATGVSYQVSYVSDKLASEYVPNLYAGNINQVVASYGEKRPATLFDSGTASASATRSMSDASKNWTVNEWNGYYLKITAGTGKGQVRVIISNTANGLVLSQDWTNLLAPDATSQYTITDVNDNSISKGSQIAVNVGSTVLITSQYPDDIFNDANIKGAIDALKEDTKGYRAYCLTLMRGLGSTEVDPINYLKAQVDSESDVLHNRWCMATVGLAKGNDNFTTFTTLASGIQDDRMALVNISDVTRDFGYGKETLDGSYVAVALSGIICTNELARNSMTRRSIATAFSVNDFVDPFTVTEKNLMGAAGVSVFERRGTDLVLRDDLTTDQSTQLSKYIRLTRMKDFVSDFLKTRLEDLTVGQVVIENSEGSADVISNTKANLNFLFSVLIANGTIRRVENLSVVLNSQDSSQLDITADIFLTPEIKYVYALLGFGV
jgi:hypothetical protein